MLRKPTVRKEQLEISHKRSQFKTTIPVTKKKTPDIYSKNDLIKEEKFTSYLNDNICQENQADTRQSPFHNSFLLSTKGN